VPLSDEKQGFSRRLRDGLKRAESGLSRPAEIAREFNLRYHGTPVTAQAVRKWLTGRALPSQDKVRVLAAWLETSPHWLRFGEPEAKGARPGSEARQDAPGYSIDASWLGRKFEALNERHRRLVMEVVVALLRLERKR